jgi:hypothetical protein
VQQPCAGIALADDSCASAGAPELILRGASAEIVFQQTAKEALLQRGISREP